MSIAICGFLFIRNITSEIIRNYCAKVFVMPYRLQGRGSDYYRIYGEKDGTTKEYHHDIAFDELGDVLDSMIETGGMTKEEYQAKVKDFVCSL